MRRADDRADATHTDSPTHPSGRDQFGGAFGIAYTVALVFADGIEGIRADDPVDDLRRSFDMHVEFGLSHPEVYALIYGDSRRGRAPAVRRKAEEMLRQMISRVAATGRLRMSVERAVQTFHAVGVGTVLTQLLIPPGERDPEVPVISRDNALSAMVADHQATSAARQDVVGQAGALREALAQDGPGQLTAAERAMMSEWLNRIANGSATG